MAKLALASVYWTVGVGAPRRVAYIVVRDGSLVAWRAIQLPEGAPQRPRDRLPQSRGVGHGHRRPAHA